MNPSALTELDNIPHRKLAAELFNHVWTLMEKPDRTREESDEMIHAAHASRHHWGIVGTILNQARGEWQISRVYSLLSRSEPALHHAYRYFDLCSENGIADFDIAYCHEAIARALAVAGDKEGTTRHVNMARDLAAGIFDDDDRELLLKDLETIPYA